MTGDTKNKIYYDVKKIDYYKSDMISFCCPLEVTLVADDIMIICHKVFILCSVIQVYEPTMSQSTHMLLSVHCSR